MKIRIITIHYGRNYGSALQAYALNRFFLDEGYDVKTIDYIPNEKTGLQLYMKLFSRKGKAYAMVRYILSTPIRMFKDYSFVKFQKKYIIMTRKYKNFDEYTIKGDSNTVYITGSDQVWNSDYNVKQDYSYYLDLKGSYLKKISYAASFGKEDIDDYEKEEIIGFLKNMDAISVRDKASFKILEKLGIKAKVVLDPTLLFDKEQWGNNLHLKEYKEKYILMYVIDGRYNEVLRVASEIMKENNELKLYLVSFSEFRNNKIDKQYVCASPKKFVELIYNAEFIVTNSFHGTIFAINFEKQFIAIKKERYNSRLQGLLEDLCLEDRFIKFDANIEFPLENIDYVRVRKQLEFERKKSRDFIKESIRA